MLAVLETCLLAMKKTKISHEGEVGVCGLHFLPTWWCGRWLEKRGVVTSTHWGFRGGSMGIPDGTGGGAEGLGAAPSGSDPASTTRWKTTELPLSLSFPISEMKGLNLVVPGVLPHLWSSGHVGRRALGRTHCPETPGGSEWAEGRRAKGGREEAGRF